MKQILSAWKSSFMTEPLVLLLATVLFWISLNKRSTEPVLRFFPFYFGLFFIHQLHLTLLRLLEQPDSASGYWLIFSRCFTYFFIFTEFWLFSRLCYQSIKSNTLRRICSYWIILTMGAMILCFIYLCCRSPAIFELQEAHHRANTLLHQVYLIESISLLLIAGLYWIDIYKRRPIHRIETGYDFWMLAGCWAYAAVIIPPATAVNIIPIQSLSLYGQMLTLIYAGYLLMFLLMLKGYSCTATKPK